MSLFGIPKSPLALICAKAKEAFDHVVNCVQIPKEGPLCKALEMPGDTDNRNMISLSNPDIEFLTYDRSDTVRTSPFIQEAQKFPHLLTSALLETQLDKAGYPLLLKISISIRLALIA